MGAAVAAGTAAAAATAGAFFAGPAKNGSSRSGSGSAFAAGAAATGAAAGSGLNSCAGALGSGLISGAGSLLAAGFLCGLPPSAVAMRSESEVSRVDSSGSSASFCVFARESGTTLLCAFLTCAPSIVSLTRLDASRSRSLSSLTAERGRQSSRPSRQTRVSEVMSPASIFEASSARVSGPTGTSRMPAYQPVSEELRQRGRARARRGAARTCGLVRGGRRAVRDARAQRGGLRCGLERGDARGARGRSGGGRRRARRSQRSGALRPRAAALRCLRAAALRCLRAWRGGSPRASVLLRWAARWSWRLGGSCGGQSAGGGGPGRSGRGKPCPCGARRGGDRGLGCSCGGQSACCGRGAAAGFGATGAAALAGGTDESMLAEPGSAASSPASTASPRTSMMCSHFLHLNFVTSRPRSFSSATWYFCLQFSQRKFIATSGERPWKGRGRAMSSQVSQRDEWGTAHGLRATKASVL
jgi:hypothetical protein